MKRYSKNLYRNQFFLAGLPVFSGLLLWMIIVFSAAPVNAEPEINRPRNFYDVLDDVLARRGSRREIFCDGKDVIANRIVKDYGSLFIAQETVVLPSACLFDNEEAVEKFQAKAGYLKAEIAGTFIELQQAAMEYLLRARAEAALKNLNITARDGAEAARRNYADTLRLWKSRFDPACRYWKKRGRLSFAQIERLELLSIREQVKEVLRLEKRGIYFNTFFNRSILYSVAAPGASQHLSMLALDINEFDNAEVRKILARHGWFRTVRNDQPHFTFLGHQPQNLKKHGLAEN